MTDEMIFESDNQLPGCSPGPSEKVLRPSQLCGRTFLYLYSVLNVNKGALFAILFSLTVCVGVSSAATRAENIREIEALIDRGEPIEAAKRLSELASANSRSPQELVALARLESNGSIGVGFFKAALAGVEHPRQREKIYLSLARYYQALGNLRELRATLSAHKREFSRSEFRDDFTKLDVFLAEREGNFKRARSTCREAMRASSSSDMRDWSRLALARFEMRDKSTHNKGRKKAFSVSTSQNSSMAPVALYMLAEDDTHSGSGKRGNDYDQAALDFNILREAFPHAIGSFDLIEIISGINSRNDGGQAEQLIGSYYSIQVGVFTAKENANRQKNQFKGYGEPVEIARKTISGKRYYAVYVGRFGSADAAASFKRTLERSEKELFNIALRQK